jgi:hypothetical protein
MDIAHLIHPLGLLLDDRFSLVALREAPIAERLHPSGDGAIRESQRQRLVRQAPIGRCPSQIQPAVIALRKLNNLITIYGIVFII